MTPTVHSSAQRPKASQEKSHMGRWQTQTISLGAQRPKASQEKSRLLKIANNAEDRSFKNTEEIKGKIEV